MDTYFYISLIVLIGFLILLWKSDDKIDYLRLHNILKIVIVSGVFCIVLIKPEVVLHFRKLI